MNSPGSDSTSATRVGLGKETTEVRFKIKVPRSALRATSQVSVCIVGDCDALGNWNHDSAVSLQQSFEDAARWSALIVLPRNQKVTYKYFIKEGTSIARWEAWKDNRTVTPLGVELFIDDGVFGVDRSATSNAEADVWEESNWLVHDTQLRIWLGDKNKDEQTMAVKPRLPTVSVYGDGVAKLHKIVFTAKDANLLPELTVLKGGEEERPEDTMKEFTFHAPESRCLSLFVDFYLDGQSDKFGRAFLVPAQFQTLAGVITTPIISSSMNIVGEFTFEFVIVLPFEHRLLQNVLARTYWKSTKTVDLGHRGCGADRAVSKSGKKTRISENTLLSFVTAGQLGRESVEFDVQISKDNIPVIFHDFWVPIDAKKKYHLSVYQLPLKQFKKIGLHALNQEDDDQKPTPTIPSRSVKDEPGKGKNSNGETSMDTKARLLRRMSLGNIEKEKSMHPHIQLHDSYATLEEAFKVVPPRTGFDIEIKYPDTDTEAGRSIPYPERNLIVDQTLKVVFDHCKSDRAIIFTSFDPDVCTMLSLKQPRYPVMFLTEGGTAMYIDQRRNSIQQAVRFAKSVNLLGIVSSARPLLASPDLIGLVKSSGLLLATYGSPNNEQESVRLQIDLGVDAIISDHLFIHARDKEKEKEKEKEREREKTKEQAVPS